MCPEIYVEDMPENTRRLFKEAYGHIKDEIGLEVTFLMNCLVGLICIISEKHKDKLAG